MLYGLCLEDPEMLCRGNRSINDLPEDVKVDILSRLSESDLITSKLVCKEWNFMISTICIPTLSPPNPATPFWNFLCFQDPPPPLEPGKKDRSSDPRNPNAHKYLRVELIVRVEPQDYYYQYVKQYVSGNPTIRNHIESLLPTMDRDPSHIVDCCNGLLLLAASNSYFVGNPVTRQRIAIPLSNNHTHESITASLVFDPRVSLQFKVVRHTLSPVDATLSVEMFSSHSGGWSSHILSLEPRNLCGFKWINKSVYFNSSLYYMSMAMYLVCIDNVLDDGQCLKAWAIELPDRNNITIEQGNKGLHGCIGYSSGCVYYSNRDTNGVIFVWMLAGKGKDSGWILKHSIRIDLDVVPSSYMTGLIVNRHKDLESFRPRAFHPNENVIVVACPYVLVFYHLETKNVELGLFAFRHRRKTLMLDQNWIFPYARSLVSLNTITSTVEQAN